MGEGSVLSCEVDGDGGDNLGQGVDASLGNRVQTISMRTVILCFYAFVMG